MLSSSTKKGKIVRKMDPWPIILDFGVWWSTWPSWTNMFASVYFVVQYVAWRTWIYLEREEFDQHRKENLRRCVDNLEEKRRIQDARRKKPEQMKTKIHEEWSKGLLHQVRCCTEHPTGWGIPRACSAGFSNQRPLVWPVCTGYGALDMASRQVAIRLEQSTGH